MCTTILLFYKQRCSHFHWELQVETLVIAEKPRRFCRRALPVLLYGIYIEVVDALLTIIKLTCLSLKWFDMASKKVIVHEKEVNHYCVLHNPIYNSILQLMDTACN